MKQSDYSRRFEAAVAEMNNAGVWRWNGMPPYLRLFRRLGFEPRPPYYVSFSKMALLSGTYFATAMGVLSYLIIWPYQVVPFPMNLISPAAAGALFGISMAVWYRYVRTKNGLSSWDDL